ncbi:ubiquitin-conjugating enzyme E2 G1 isoform X1 [Salmo salar]|uniref:Ubiquitin-conjugating enzyme E2 G1 n=1 Tax=Salmo salar TaxID=8030 RepID=A0A1S3NL08_SALSA|nr:ubiquitin-conjugating enzyme E2 G1 isoform X1 [Salmo salar]|eukprot:XP_014015886.1 PREDICTED: ubiquitin-conjugating enzyme E2 G1-like isoform X1 [Salmo salar]
MTEQSALLLRKQLAELNKNPVEGFSAGLIDDEDIYKWEVVIIGPQDTLFEGGFFKAYLTFPYDYPLRPPKMKFITEIWHPNVAKNGDVCISILHEPGEDKFGYEKPEERWLPIHTVETIMISVISMLADPNSDSPANVDAASGGRILMVNSRGRWLAVYGKARRWHLTRTQTQWQSSRVLTKCPIFSHLYRMRACQQNHVKHVFVIQHLSFDHCCLMLGLLSLGG